MGIKGRRILSGLGPILVAGLLMLPLTGCTMGAEERGGAANQLRPVELAPGERLRVVATTSFVHDVVVQIGDDLIQATRLIPLGIDPHSFEPTPQDVAMVSEAHLVFVNGAGLESFLDTLLESSGATGRLVSVSENIQLAHLQDDHEGETEHEGDDPHTWTSPLNVMIWCDNIVAALSAVDPDNSERFGENAAAYKAELEGLDAWIRLQVDRIRPEDRILVTDHQMFGYLAQAYGFEQVGAIIPGFTTVSQSSASELADLVEVIRERQVPALFVGRTVNAALAEVIAGDTGAELVFLYTGSLGEAGGEAGSYLDYMRYNMDAIGSALD